MTRSKARPPARSANARASEPPDKRPPDRLPGAVPLKGSLDGTETLSMELADLLQGGESEIRAFRVRRWNGAGRKAVDIADYARQTVGAVFLGAPDQMVERFSGFDGEALLQQNGALVDFFI